ncbi:MAG: hypothetical protein ACREMN_14030 [Gemmatimonadales bacterium]
MVETRRFSFYGVSLLAGVLLFGIAGLRHPLLVGDGAAQLAMVSATGGWRVMHWALLFGLPLMYVGLVGLALRHGDTPGSATARAGILLAGFSFAVWALNILFMAASGWHLARAYVAANTGLTGSHAVFVYDMIHPTGLAAERLATFGLGLVAYLFGWAIRSGGVYPRWLAGLAWVVGLGSVAVAVASSELSPNVYYAQGLVVLWLAAAGVMMVLERARATRP